MEWAKVYVGGCVAVALLTGMVQGSGDGGVNYEKAVLVSVSWPIFAPYAVGYASMKR